MVYDEYGRIRRAQFSDRRSVTFEYDADSQKMASYYGNDSRPDRWSFGWSYNVDGQIESESLFLPASGAALSRYRYNSLQYLESTLRNQSASYLYDEVGLTRTLASSIIDRSNAVIRKGTNQWTMDLFGRIVRKNDLGMVYNGQGRLKKVKLANGQDVTYYHDENSHLVFREGEVDGGNLYLAEEVLSDGKNLIEKFSIGGLFLGRIRNGSFEFSPVDRVGTPLSTFGDSDSWHDPFGKGKVTDIRLDFGFAGLVRDPLTGFVNMGVRDYEPELGQFTTPDPLYFEEPSLCLESPVECNLYSYAKNNPLKYVDPTGTSSAEISIRRFENLVLKGESSKAMAEAKVRAAGAAGGLGGSLLVGAATGANFGAAVGASSQVVRTAAIELTSAAWLNAGAAGSYAASRAQSLTQSVSYYAQSTYRQVASFEIVFQDKYKSSALGSIGSAALGLFGESSPDALSNRIDLANALLSLADKEKIMTFANNFNASVEGLGRLMQVSFGPSLPKFDISNVNLENFDLPAEQNP
jgi:RHS repeat-associated protein